MDLIDPERYHVLESLDASMFLCMDTTNHGSHTLTMSIPGKHDPVVGQYRCRQYLEEELRGIEVFSKNPVYSEGQLFLVMGSMWFDVCESEADVLNLRSIPGKGFEKSDESFSVSFSGEDVYDWVSAVKEFSSLSETNDRSEDHFIRTVILTQSQVAASIPDEVRASMPQRVIGGSLGGGKRPYNVVRP